MAVSHIRTAAKFKQTVLVIDDQSTVLDIHVAILKSLKLNLNVISMSDPNEALAYLRQKQVDLIVTDFSIMQLSAKAFIKKFKETNIDTVMPIIVISLHQDKKLEEELITSGATAYLTKPANLHELSRMAYSLLQESKQTFKQTNKCDLETCY